MTTGVLNASMIAIFSVMSIAHSSCSSQIGRARNFDIPSDFLIYIDGATVTNQGTPIPALLYFTKGEYVISRTGRNDPQYDIISNEAIGNGASLILYPCIGSEIAGCCLHGDPGAYMKRPMKDEDYEAMYAYRKWADALDSIARYSAHSVLDIEVNGRVKHIKIWSASLTYCRCEQRVVEYGGRERRDSIVMITGIADLRPLNSIEYSLWQKIVDTWLD
jgi:hypothetical protein